MGIPHIRRASEDDSGAIAALVPGLVPSATDDHHATSAKSCSARRHARGQAPRERSELEMPLVLQQIEHRTRAVAPSITKVA